MAVAHSYRNPSSNPSTFSSSRVRLSLQTIFSHNRSPRKSSGAMTSSTTTTSSASSVRTSPSASYSSFRSPTRDVHHNMAAISPILGITSHSSSPTNFIRRQPSAIDLALEQEKHADHVELLGLGLLEPRPRANTSSSTTSSQHCSMMEFMHESMQTPVVLDGIFEVLDQA